MTSRARKKRGFEHSLLFPLDRAERASRKALLFSLCRFDSRLRSLSLSFTAPPSRSSLSSLLPRQRARQNKSSSKVGRCKCFFSESEINSRQRRVLHSMPPLQRYLPSAWDRGGLLGPRGNARFLEVDGLRVKYTGRLAGWSVFLEEEGDDNGRRGKKCRHAGDVFHRSTLGNAPCCFCVPWTALLRRSKKAERFLLLRAFT